MNLAHIESLKALIFKTSDLNSLRAEILKEFDHVIHFLKDRLEKDVHHLAKEVQELQRTPLENPKIREIIGHIVMDFGELRKDLETEI